jgi:Bacterial Ig-like domain/Baseplate J-like protein
VTAVYNRPGLPSVAFRAGTHPTLLQRMLRDIPGVSPDGRTRPLARLRTRASDDPSIALLDAWAMVGDVLTFYQERIANEGFLRTATERRSVLELARMIGYELGPGVAAGTRLVFQVESRVAVEDQSPSGLGPPTREAIVPRGTKVRSIPAKEGLPQTFETSRALLAHSDWNELRPRLTVPQPISLGSRELYVEGIATGLARGDRVLITGPRPLLDDKDDTKDQQEDGKDQQQKPPPGVEASILEVEAVEPQPDRGRTRLKLSVLPKFPPASQPAAPTPQEPAPDFDFEPPPPPAVDPVKPAELEPAKVEIKERPLTADEIRSRVLRYLWHDVFLVAQIALFGWRMDFIVEYLRRHYAALLEPVRWVQVTPPRDVKRPTVLEPYPKDGADDVHPNTTIIVPFSEPMDPTSTLAAVSLRETDTGNAAPVSKAYHEATGAVRLTPTPKLASDTKYTLVVTTGARDRAQPAGNPLAARFESTFTVIDYVGPTVVKRTPDRDAGEVAAKAVVTAEFSEPVQNATPESFFLRDATGTRVPVRVDPADQGKKAVLSPLAPLALSTRYTATLTTGITDTDGNAIPPEEWSFTTEPRKQYPPAGEVAAYAFRERAAFFGHNAPRWASLPKHDPATQHGDNDPFGASWDDPQRSIWVDSQGSSYGGDTVHLDRDVAELEPGSWTVFESATGAAAYYVNNVSTKSLADYSMSARSSQLTLSQRDGLSPSEGVGSPPDFRVRETEAHVRSEPLELVELPIDDPLKKDDVEVTLDQMVIGLEAGRELALRGELLELPGVIGHEILVLKEATHGGGFTTLRFRTGLTQSYVRKTVMLSANVVAATHGETVAGEVLGGGDGSKGNQHFELRKPPLTHVQAPTPTGGESTLELRVDDVLWREAPVLFGLGPRSRSYIVRTDDAGKTAVVFGDGERGARLPTGTENVVATYRSGIGMAGMVPADSLALLQERPLGIASVTNPLPAEGAAEPESRDDARENAPLTVLTMGRVVSLRDFEDFARAFAGVGKAQAIDVWRDGTHLIHLTVGAEGGAPAGAELIKNLEQALEAARQPGLTVIVDSYARRFFDLAAQIRIDPAYLAEKVIAAARAALFDEFSFERRGFGQPVTAAEVIQVIEGVPGVIATYLRALFEFREEVPQTSEEQKEVGVAQALPASQARLVEGEMAAAELLLINPAGADVTERSA